MLGFGALGQLALAEAGGLRQDFINIARGTGSSSSERRRRYGDDDNVRKAYERRRDLIRRHAKREWVRKEGEWRREEQRRHRRALEARRRAAALEAERLQRERQRLLAEALLAIHDAARQAELAAHIAQIETRLQALYLQTLDDDTITVLLLAA